MIKICYVIGQLDKGGAEKQLFQLINNLDRTKFECYVICLDKGGFWADKIRNINVELFELERKKSFDFSRLKVLHSLIKKIKPEIVHTYLSSANSYGRIASILNRTPIIIASERSLYEYGKDKTLLSLLTDKLLSLFSTAVICNSNKASQNLVNKYKYNPAKVFIIHNGIDAEIYHSAALENQSEIVIGTVGNLNKQKNHEMFLQVAKGVIQKTRNESIKFKIVGDGPLKEKLVEIADQIGITNNIEFTGLRNDIPDQLSQLSIFLMTSFREGLSNSIMEAMAAEKPVIVTDVGGTKELIVHGETGYLVKSDDAKSMIFYIEQLLNNKKKLLQFGKSGYSLINRKFSVTKLIDETTMIYNRLITEITDR